MMQDSYAYWVKSKHYTLKTYPLGMEGNLPQKGLPIIKMAFTLVMAAGIELARLVGI